MDPVSVFPDFRRGADLIASPPQQQRCVMTLQSNGPVLRIFMREVTWGHEIESETGNSIDLGSFLMS